MIHKREYHWKIKNDIVTGRNEVLAKVIFSQACVKNSVHREGYLTRHPPQTRQVHPWTRQAHPPDQAGTPPRTRHPPWDPPSRPGRYTPGPGRYPSDQAPPSDQTPLQTRQVHPPRTRQVHTPWTRQVHPSGTRHPPPRPGRYTPPTRQVHPHSLWTRQEQQTPEYGQCSAGMHPTGMHSCVNSMSNGVVSFTIYYWQSMLLLL